MSFVNNITSTFDIEQLDGDDLSWYQDCLNSIENHKTSINETEDGVKLTTHFEQPTEDLCKALLNFTMNDVSIFTHGWQKVMIGSYS